MRRREGVTDHADYVEQAKRASELVESGELGSALGVLHDLLASDISEVDKSMMCLNLAVVYDKLDRIDDALAAFDRGEGYEQRHGRFYVAEQRAVFLAEKGRDAESLAAYERLLGRPEPAEDDKERIRRNIELLRARRS